MFIVRPDMADEDVDKVVSTIDAQVTTAGGAVKSVDRMGKRRLAYLVRNFADGLFILFTIEGPGSAISEVERRLRVTEPVIKFITVRVDEEQKRLGKVKAIRDSRRRGQGTHAQAAAAAEAAQTAEPPAEQAPAQA
jgi:small subunit ribosomal protein S6